MSAVPSPILERLQADLGTALRARDALRTSVLRSTLSAIANAEAVEVPPGTTATEVSRKALTDDDIRAVVLAERAELVSAARDLRAHARPDAADELEARAAI